MRNVANANVQIEPSEEDWALYVNKAIEALKRDRSVTKSTDIIKQLERDFGLNQRRIYELMDDEFKKECKKADLHLDGTPKDDESESLDSRQLSQVIDKGFKEKAPTEEDLLISELGKFNITAERKVPFKRPYKYPRHSLQNNVR